MDVEDFEPGKGGPKGIRKKFQDNSTGSVSVQGRDVGPDSPDEVVLDQLSTQSLATDHLMAPEEVGVPTILRWR